MGTNKINKIKRGNMIDKLMNITDIADKMGFCYEYTRRVVNFAYDSGCKSIIKIGIRMRIKDYENFIIFLGELR